MTGSVTTSANSPLSYPLTVGNWILITGADTKEV